MPILVQIGPVVSGDKIKMQKVNDGRMMTTDGWMTMMTDAQW